jgi:hypothetical protein
MEQAMAFTPKEVRQWHEDKQKKEAEPPRYRSTPVAVCIHCQNPFGINEGVITPEFAICDVCNGD